MLSDVTIVGKARRTFDDGARCTAACRKYGKKFRSVRCRDNAGRRIARLRLDLAQFLPPQQVAEERHDE